MVRDWKKDIFLLLKKADITRSSELALREAFDEVTNDTTV
jgi:hypothetical protein